MSSSALADSEVDSWEAILAEDLHILVASLRRHLAASDEPPERRAASSVFALVDMLVQDVVQRYDSIPRGDEVLALPSLGFLAAHLAILEDSLRRPRPGATAFSWHAAGLHLQELRAQLHSIG